MILLVDRGVTLPSNLQGLYRCDFEGDRLDDEATMKLLKDVQPVSLIRVYVLPNTVGGAFSAT